MTKTTLTCSWASRLKASTCSAAWFLSLKTDRFTCRIWWPPKSSAVWDLWWFWALTHWIVLENEITLFSSTMVLSTTKVHSGRNELNGTTPLLHSPAQWNLRAPLCQRVWFSVFSTTDFSASRMCHCTLLMQHLVLAKTISLQRTTWSTSIWALTVNQLLIIALAALSILTGFSHCTKMVHVKSHNDFRDFWSRKELCDWTGNFFVRWEPISTTMQAHTIGFVIAEL